MSSNKKQDDPPMATLNRLDPPGRARGSLWSGLTIFLLVVIIGLLVALMVRPAKLDVYKTADEIQFADPALAACVRQTMDARGWNDIGHVVSLRCNHPDGDAIVSLEGIEHLVSLIDVNLAFNAIADISPLADLPQLTVIDLSHNRLKDVPVMRAAGRIERLELNYNQFESLDWLGAHFLVLQSLSVAHNHIDSLAPLTGVAQLRELNARNNRIFDVEAVFALLDLEMADLGSNEISDVAGMNSLTSLRRLFLDRNRLSSAAGLEDLIELEELDLSNNPLQDVSQLRSMQRLQRVDLSFTQISDLAPLLALGDIEVLRIHGDIAVSCDDVAAAIEEFGPSAVRHDAGCDTGR